MSESFSRLGSFVHTPCGPRKSGMPDSVEMPAPVSARMRREHATISRAVRSSSVTEFHSKENSILEVRNRPKYRDCQTIQIAPEAWRRPDLLMMLIPGIGFAVHQR